MTLADVVKEYWDEAAGIALGLLLTVALAQGWISIEAYSAAVALAATVGIRVMKLRDANVKAEAEQAVKLAHGAHVRIDASNINNGILPMTAEEATQFAAARLYYDSLTNPTTTQTEIQASLPPSVEGPR
jgi:uncharacterized protein (DUF2345 family)